jgi:hypothetical protein
MTRVLIPLGLAAVAALVAAAMYLDAALTAVP